MAKINLLRKSTKYDNNAQSYQLSLEVMSSENINKFVFICQRFRNAIKNNFEDIFVAVCTPAQLEELDIDSPAANSSYFRTNKISLISRNLAYLEEIVQSIIRELQKLVEDSESLTLLETDGVYEITSDNINLNTAMIHTHYRLPLVARPAGNNEIFTEDDIQYQRVASQNSALAGWLNATDLAGYKFKYNIAADTSLSALWPISEDKLSYAHLEVDGISWDGQVQINANGIYWKDNVLDTCPFPSDYLNTSSYGTPSTLVLDFIV